MMRERLKELELCIRRFYLRQSQRPFRGELVTTAWNVLPTATPRILLLRQDRIDDVLCSTPILDMLRRAFPHAQMDIVLSHNNIALADVVRHWCDHVWCYAKTVASFLHLRRMLRRMHYDVVVDLMDNPSTTSTLLLGATNAPFRFGIFKENAWAYTHCVPLLDRSRYHYVERIAQLLLPFGIDPAAAELDLRYPLSQSDITRAACDLGLLEHPERCGFVFIHTSTRHHPLQWEWGRYRELVQMIHEQFPSLAVGIGGTSDDADAISAIAMQSGAFVLPTLPFHRYAAMLYYARLLITPDTSIVHAAAALKVPAVVLFHRGDERLLPWYPYRSPYRALVSNGSVNAIAASDVLAATCELLAENSPPTGERIFAAL
ncbi:MAG: lipopolysaccharide heptosyltransferase family protein [Chlorobiota bacterium]|nr:MAG: lipopolysaccharide heptosyltransferase family protein [Chlorobiota bacterium]